MEAPVMMDDVVVHANKAAPTMTTVAINQKRIQSSIIQEQFYLKHIMFSIEKFCIDFFYYLKIDKKAFLRRKRKKFIFLI
jgi:hypothetical protein